MRDQRCPENRRKTTARCHPERSEGSHTNSLVTLSRLCVPRFDREIPRSARDDNAFVGGAHYLESFPHDFSEDRQSQNPITELRSRRTACRFGFGEIAKAAEFFVALFEQILDGRLDNTL